MTMTTSNLIIFNQTKDSVIRTIFHKYFDPKEALISNGVVNRSLPIAAGVFSKFHGDNEDEKLSNANIEWQNAAGVFSKFHGDNEDENNFSASLDFVYPYGCTLSVNRESVTVLSTGTVCYPVSRPVCAFHQLKKDVILKFLSGSLELNQIDANEPNISDEQPIPDNMQLSSKIKLCLQENEFDHTYFGDFIKLFDQSLSSIGLENWPEAKRFIFKNICIHGDGDDLPHTYLPVHDESGNSVEIESDWTRQQNNTNIIEDGEENFDQAFSEISND
uniref:DUF3825 domain-containing protein n=1 Tax=Meloidogyne hapla TaxID=6305 RepID=A0A1I8BBF2_MELHA